MTRIFLLAIVATLLFSQGYDFSKCERILQTYVDDFGRVKYRQLVNDMKNELHQEVQYAASQNPKDHPKKYTNNSDKLAYWINLYNHLVINEVVQHYPINSIQEIENVWKKKRPIGRLQLSLDDIENEIIRKEFQEERIHFALICAAYSCPKLQKFVYKGSKLNEQLTNISNDFFGNPLNFILDKTDKTIFISKIFDWYLTDFNFSGLAENNYTDRNRFIREVVLDYLSQKSTPEIQAFIKENRYDIKVNVMLWHWKLNESI